jgi:MFS family permease
MKQTLDVAKFIDERGVGPFQILVLMLCFVIMIIDGFDAQAIGFVAPIISVAWGVSKASFSPVFAAGLFGMAIGALFFGTPVVGQLMDWFGPVRMLALSFLLASICIALTGSASSHLALKIIVFLAGFFSVGAHLGLSALSGELYPTFTRATGVGWALGIGRIGSLISPVLGGLLLAWQWQVTSIFLAVAVPAGFAALSVLLVGYFSTSAERDGIPLSDRAVPNT